MSTAPFHISSAEAPHRKSGAPRDIKRMSGLERACEHLGGQVPLADALGIHPRFLRQKICADRPIWDADLRLATLALRARAAATIALADKLEALIGGGS